MKMTMVWVLFIVWLDVEHGKEAASAIDMLLMAVAFVLAVIEDMRRKHE